MTSAFPHSLVPIISHFRQAHIHHAYEFYLNHPDAISAMVVRTLFQFAYTTLFGWFATFVFLRTGSVWVVIATHSFCNFMGVPHLGLVDGPRWRSVIYIACLFGGAWGFKHLLWPLTESSNALAYLG
jgi:prenyl protein peptidase